MAIDTKSSPDCIGLAPKKTRQVTCGKFLLMRFYSCSYNFSHYISPSVHIWSNSRVLDHLNHVIPSSDTDGNQWILIKQEEKLKYN